MYFFLVSYPILGAGLKFIDEAFDAHLYSKKIAYLLAPLLGVLWAYTMMIDAASATILLAIVLGVLLKGKIDNYAHFAGLAIIFAAVFLLGIELLYLPLLILTLAALGDEIGNDYVEKKSYLTTGGIVKKAVGYFFDHRWATKVAILGLAMIGMIPVVFFLAMIFFDGAYLLVRWYPDIKQRFSDEQQQPSLVTAIQ